MGTPQKSRIGAPGLKVEESPVFNYLSNLSPIKHVKSIHMSQSFTSLNLTSPSSLFTSPHIGSSFKDSTFLKRHRFSDQSSTEDSDEGTKDSSNEEFVGSCQVSENADKEDFDLEHPSMEVNTNHGEQLEVPNVKTMTLEYDDGTPACDSKSQLFTDQRDGGSAEASCPFAPFVQGTLKETPDKSDGIRGTFQNTPLREMLRLRWDNLASDAADSLFVGSPNETRAFRGLFDKTPGTGENPGSLASLFPENTNDLQLAQPICHVDSVGGDMDQEVDPEEDSQPQHLDWPPESFLFTVQDGTPNYSSENIDDQLISNSHQRVRRRCLTFETFDGHRKSLSSIANRLPCVPLQSEEMRTSRYKQSILSKKLVGACSSNPVKDGIGLHLNALATTKDDHISLPENLAPGVEISVSSSITPFSPRATYQESLHTASYLKDTGPVRMDIQVSNDDSPTITPIEELNSISPRKKRSKLAHAGDDASCKRCTCKKSKCLKLYCECFAAGVYCIEPCSCQDCYNKPIHEDTVLATRKQIEARNPLAFAPKVIRASQATPDVGDEMANTPASARHKRGCNCKKSSCLKKYCECYQGGVGCSLNCRCESCKNTYGRKDGSGVDQEVETGAEEEKEPQPTEKSFADRGSQKGVIRINEEKNMNPSFPVTPSRLSRLSVKLQFPSKGKSMRSSFLSTGSSDGSQNGVKLSSIPLPPKFEKSMPTTHAEEIPELLQNKASPRNSINIKSPNSKRVSPPQCKSRASPSRRSTRRLTLQGIPSFPPINQRVSDPKATEKLQHSELTKLLEDES